MRAPLLLALTLAAAGTAAAAPNSTQGGPPRADAISGGTPAGDPDGAVRALSRVGGGGAAATVTVPKLGGEGPSRTPALPAGTR